MVAIAADDFTYKIHLFDDTEMDTSKVHQFKKGDELPLPLVQRLEKFGPESWIGYKGGSKKEDIPGKVDLGKKEGKEETSKTPEKKVYTKEELEEKAEEMDFNSFRDWSRKDFGITGRTEKGIIEDIILVQEGKKEREV